MAISYAFIGFYTLGLTYLDDNALERNSPALLGAALASRFVGYQIGYFLSILLNATSTGWWLGWSIIAPVLLIVAVVIGLFPMRMIATAVREAANEIVETATNNSQISLARGKFLSDISFTSSIKRILSNKVLILNVIAVMFIETALINFALHTENYLESRFLFPIDDSGLAKNEWTSRTISKFVQPTLVALAILVGGLIISKVNPSAR